MKGGDRQFSSWADVPDELQEAVVMWDQQFPDVEVAEIKIWDPPVENISLFVNTKESNARGSRAYDWCELCRKWRDLKKQGVCWTEHDRWRGLYR